MTLWVSNSTPLKSSQTLRVPLYHLLLFFLLCCIAASKNFMHNCIYLWSWSATKAQKPDRKSLEVSAVVLTELQWTSTEIPYLSLNTCPGSWSYCLFGSRMDGRTVSPPVVMAGVSVSLCVVCCFLPPGRGYIVCGDDKGRLWTYHVTGLQKSNFQAGKPIQPTEVFIFSSSGNLHT